jgi:hypothetical protein
VPDTGGTMDFVHQQLELFRRQSEAIQRGDLVAAKSTGDQLQRSVPGLIQIVNLSRNGGSFTELEKESIEQIVGEIKILQENTHRQIISRKEHLSELLHEFRRGRQLLTGYRSGSDVGGRLFDMVG